ncbi:hypothetical protein BYT27DRAFT_7192958, partial [Phlegmacium glaucopus]
MTSYRIKYAKANHARGRYSWEPMSQAVDILIAKTGIRMFDTETALVDPTVPGDTIIPWNRSEEPMVPLLAICSNHPKSYRKPSQAQVDQLPHILGRRLTITPLLFMSKPRACGM